MSVPTLVKTWQHSNNQTVTAQGTQAATNKRAIRTIKNLLIGFGTLPWSVRGSSNGTTANTSDNWSSDSDINGASAGSPHSWVCLRQTGIASNFEIVFDIVSASNYTSLTCVVSPSAAFSTFTSTSNRPTATDEIVLVNNTTWGGNQGSSVDNNVIVNAQQSTDGQCTRFWTYWQNVCTGLYIFDKPQNVVSGWTNPSYSFGIGSSLGAATVSNLMNSANGRGRGSATFSMYLTCEGAGSATNQNLPALLTSANDFSGEWPFLPMGIASTQASHRGRHGSLFDAYFGSTTGNQGDTFPNDAANRQWVQVGSGLLLPWGLASTAPVLA